MAKITSVRALGRTGDSGPRLYILHSTVGCVVRAVQFTSGIGDGEGAGAERAVPWGCSHNRIARGLQICPGVGVREG